MLVAPARVVGGERVILYGNGVGRACGLVKYPGKRVCNSGVDAFCLWLQDRSLEARLLPQHWPGGHACLLSSDPLR